MEHYGIEESNHGKVGISHVTVIVARTHRDSLRVLQCRFCSAAKGFAVGNVLPLGPQPNNTGQQALV
jgi:hypothetical protein